MSILQRPILHPSKGSKRKSNSLYLNGQSAERPQINFKYSLLKPVSCHPRGSEYWRPWDLFWQAFHPLFNGVHMGVDVLLAIPRVGWLAGGRAVYFRSISITHSLFCLHQVQKYSNLTALKLSFYQRAIQPSQCLGLNISKLSLANYIWDFFSWQPPFCILWRQL